MRTAVKSETHAALTNQQVLIYWRASKGREITMAAGPADQQWKPKVNPWVIASTVALAAFMEVLDTSIANVALPHIAGNLGASTDEGTWVLTSYLVSNAIVLPMGAWASSVIGRKRFFMLCILIFTAASFLCGIAPSLPYFASSACRPGRRRRWHAADGASDYGGLVRRKEARPGVCAVRSGRRTGAIHRPYPGRLDHGQLLLALDLLPQHPGRVF
jgi:hypothetical protein